MATFQPPIHLDPNQDSSQQTSFINQNFQSLAAALESNSFRIVSEGNLTIPSFNSTSTTGNFTTKNSSVSYTHNLGYTPFPLVSLQNGTQYSPIPFSNVVGIGTTASWVTYLVGVDNAALTVTAQLTLFGSTSQSFSGQLLKFYLLQITAN